MTRDEVETLFILRHQGFSLNEITRITGFANRSVEVRLAGIPAGVSLKRLDMFMREQWDDRRRDEKYSRNNCLSYRRLKRIYELRQEGLSLGQIAKKMRIKDSTIENRLWGVPRGGDGRTPEEYAQHEFYTTMRQRRAVREVNIAMEVKRDLKKYLKK